MKIKKLMSITFLLSFISIAVYAMSSSREYEYGIPVITNAEYAKVSTTEKNIAIAFNATWCPACMAQHKALVSVYDKHKENLPIYVYDWDKIDDFTGPKVKQRTTIAIFSKNKIIDELIGENNPDKISSFLRKYSNK